MTAGAIDGAVSWSPGTDAPAFSAAELSDLVGRIREPLVLLAPDQGRGPGLGVNGELHPRGGGRFPVWGYLPPVYPEWLGDRTFTESYGLRFPYVAGEMAAGIASTAMVRAMAGAGMLGVFGAGGLAPARVEQAVTELRGALPDRTWGVNLIHSPAEPELEDRVGRLLVAAGVPVISLSAFMGLTPAAVRCAAHGLRPGPDGVPVRPRRIMVKLSRPEVATQFLAPPPEGLLRDLVDCGDLTVEEAALAARLPVADDVTVESDSGGHTDNRPLGVLLPAILSVRAEVARSHPAARGVRVGVAGGLGTPASVAAAFATGAAYVVTGSVNQTAVEAGISEDARALLAEADIADVTMAPAADMFELGVQLQVLRRGTLFPQRAKRLYELYRTCPTLEDIPAGARTVLEQQIFRASLDEVWAGTQRFWRERDPAQLERAARDGRHRMALVFRWYLGRSTRWAIEGDESRRMDYQIWCGPAVGAFNRWIRGSFLADPRRRTVVQIARNLLEGAAVVARAQQLRQHGVPVPPDACAFAPRPLR